MIIQGGIRESEDQTQEACRTSGGNTCWILTLTTRPGSPFQNKLWGERIIKEEHHVM